MSYSEGTEVDKSQYFNIYRSEALILLRLKRYKRSLKMLNEALDIHEDDLTCLLARSKCYLEIGEPEKALEDAHKTQKEKPVPIKGLILKAESFYQMGHFEYALLYFHRGFQMRPEVDQFMLGIHKCEEAIANAIGDKFDLRLTKDGYDPYFVEEQEKFIKLMEKLEGKKKLIKQTPFAMGKKVKVVDKKYRVQPIKNERTVKQLLGELYKDKVYLEKLIKETEEPVSWSKINGELNTLSTQCLEYLDKRTLFWQQLLPAHNREVKRLRESFRNLRQGTEVEAWSENNLDRMRHLYSVNRFEEAIYVGRSTLKKLKQSLGLLSYVTGQKLLQEVHSVMGSSYLKDGVLDKALLHHERDRQIAEELDDEENLGRALSNIGRVHVALRDYHAAVNIFSEKLPLTHDPQELCWLQHEMGQCHYELHQASKAVEHGMIALEIAEALEDNDWRLRCYMLLAQAHVKLDEYPEAEHYYLESLRMSVRTKNRQAQSLIEKNVREVRRHVTKANRAVKFEGLGAPGTAAGDKTDTNSTVTDESVPASDKGGQEKEADLEAITLVLQQSMESLVQMDYGLLDAARKTKQETAAKEAARKSPRKMTRADYLKQIQAGTQPPGKTRQAKLAKLQEIVQKRIKQPGLRKQATDATMMTNLTVGSTKDKKPAGKEGLSKPTLRSVVKEVRSKPAVTKTTSRHQSHRDQRRAVDGKHKPAVKDGSEGKKGGLRSPTKTSKILTPAHSPDTTEPSDRPDHSATSDTTPKDTD